MTPTTPVTPTSPVRGRLEGALRSARDGGRKLLVPYVTGGMDDDWLTVVEAVVAAGADAVEVGIPFSDPMIDGPTIQAASLQALERGTTPTTVIDALGQLDIETPVAVMTYANIVARAGEARFARGLRAARVAGAIIPDLPLEEAASWREAAAAAGVDAVLLVAPATPDERARAIAAASRGFLYAVGTMGVTGERGSLARSSLGLARRLQPMTDLPICVGIGVSTAEQAAEVCTVADGVVVGSALVRRLLDGEGPDGAHAFVAQLRAAIDEV